MGWRRNLRSRFQTLLLKCHLRRFSQQAVEEHTQMQLEVDTKLQRSLVVDGVVLLSFKSASNGVGCRAVARKSKREKNTRTRDSKVNGSETLHCGGRTSALHASLYVSFFPRSFFFLFVARLVISFARSLVRDPRIRFPLGTHAFQFYALASEFCAFTLGSSAGALKICALAL